MGTIEDEKKKKKQLGLRAPVSVSVNAFQICSQKAAAERRSVIAI